MNQIAKGKFEDPALGSGEFMINESDLRKNGYFKTKKIKFIYL